MDAEWGKLLNEIESIVTAVESLSSKTESGGLPAVPALPDVKRRTRAATENIAKLKQELNAAISRTLDIFPNALGW